MRLNLELRHAERDIRQPVDVMGASVWVGRQLLHYTMNVSLKSDKFVKYYDNSTDRIERRLTLSNSASPADARADRFTRRIDELRQRIAPIDPFILAKNTAASYIQTETAQGEFHLSLWESEILLSFPKLVARNRKTGKEIPPINQAMLLYYFNTADCTPVSGRWISFSELPDGRFYNQAFQGYSGQQLARTFLDDQSSFEQAAESLLGVRQSLGGASFSFQVLPRVSLLVVFWQGDEDFPSSFQILFDASASHYLPTDAYAILGSTLTGRLMAVKD